MKIIIIFQGISSSKGIQRTSTNVRTRITGPRINGRSKLLYMVYFYPAEKKIYGVNIKYSH
jgi:hypothetical protein